ncbi:uncharacterized protein LOC126746117 [Anthonomus grandis grandis]|uniref:uncharacterized protein LOC126746117 n=1 Tax=Anthonomus grandis grandis TaxID=2921223 RepID=UPI002165C5F6|nr:uncharacterized protein LOC126746117 [Anthonomus grandis grandis]
MDSQIFNANVSASDLDEETKKKLKGDTIGDTLYSESFVLKTLMTLTSTKLELTEDLEQDLCFLWDMTVEKDVCEYLFDVKYPSIVCEVLPACEEARLIEILIGTLANTLLADCDKSISESEVETVLKEFETSDSAVLVQLMRFLEALAHGAPHLVNLLDENRFIFILNYSENEELITQTIRTLVRVTKGFNLSEVKLSVELVMATMEGFKTVFLLSSDLDNKESKAGVKTFLVLMANYCAYAQQFHKEDVCSCISDSEVIRDVLSEVIKYFSEETNLFPVTDDFCDCISSFNVIISTGGVSMVSSELFKEIFLNLLQIFHYLHKARQECVDSFNVVLELLGLTFHILDQEIVLNELKHVPYKRGIVVLNCLKENSRTFDFDICDKLKFMYANFK